MFIYCYLIFSFLVALITTVQLFHLLVRETTNSINKITSHNALWPKWPLLIFFSCIFILAPGVYIAMLNNKKRNIILANIHFSIDRVFKKEQDL